MIRVPTSTHFTLSDTILDLYNKQNAGLKLFNSKKTTIEHIRALMCAENELKFVECFFSLSLVSNLSSHDKDPFVQIWTSLIDQGTGKVDIVAREKSLYEELNPLFAFDTTIKKMDLPKPYLRSKAFLKDIENKRKFIKSGTIQVPLNDFDLEDEFLVSGESEFTLYFPVSTTNDDPRAQELESKHTDTAYQFESKYPADTAIHFQVHSNIGNSEGKMAYCATGTGMITLAEIGEQVRLYLKDNGILLSDASEENIELDVSNEPLRIEIPLILNSISSQDPSATMVSKISQKDASTLRSKNEAMCEGFLILCVHIEDSVTKNFFGRDLAFSVPNTSDVSFGNFSHIATSMKMHVMRDMFPFIEKFTSDIATIKEKKGGTIVERKWSFKPSLPEAKNIHAPFNKVNVHTLPGFTYYHDRAMQRLPSSSFILNVTKIVLKRRGMTKNEFIKHTNNPVLVVADKKQKETYKINPKFVHVLRIVAEIATAFPTSMNYRGDYADLNTDMKENFERMMSSHKHIHRAQHTSGMTKRVSGTKHYTSYHRTWKETLKIGTEIFGDAMIDKSGDCEDFAKLISRMLAGMYSAKSKHPLILSIQSVLKRYIPFSNLSSVTSASIQTAPTSHCKIEGKKKSHSNPDDTIIGSQEDITTKTGAHMFSTLMNKKDILKSIQKTSSKIECLPDGFELDSGEKEQIARDVLHKKLWYLSPSGEPIDVDLTQQSCLISGNPKNKDDVHRAEEMERFVQNWCPPLILEGTGQANALVNALSSYHTQLEDKINEINDTLLRIEATTRLISGKSSKEVTSADIRENMKIFRYFVMPIETNKLVDSCSDLRISNFYRMITEMYNIPHGWTDKQITPKSIVDSQQFHNLHRNLLYERYNRSENDRFLQKRMKQYIKKKDNEVNDRSLYGVGRNSESDEDDPLYSLDRIIPVQIYPRKLESDIHEHKARKMHKELTYGVNLTDFVHKKENVGIIRMIKSLPSEQCIIANVLRHTQPSMFFELPSGEETKKVKQIAKKYEKMLMKNIDNVVTRNRFEEFPDVPISIYTRIDCVEDFHIKKLAKYLSINMYTEKVTVTAESFTNDHHLLRITIYMIITDTLQLNIQSNMLTKNFRNENDMNHFLEKQLSKLFS